MRTAQAPSIERLLSLLLDGWEATKEKRRPSGLSIFHLVSFEDRSLILDELAPAAGASSEGSAAAPASIYSLFPAPSSLFPVSPGNTPSACARSACPGPWPRPSPARAGSPAPWSAWWSGSRACTGCEYPAPPRRQSDPLLHRLGEERHAAGLGRQHLQRAPRVAHLGAAHLVAKQQSDRVDHRPRQLLHPADGLLQVSVEALSSPSVIR
jgi:hypothetical protein